MLFLRLLAGWAVLVAIIALISDATPALLADTPFQATPLGKHWFDLSPTTLTLAQSTTQRYISPWLWDPVIIALLKVPTFVVFGILGLLLALASRRRRGVDIFAN